MSAKVPETGGFPGSSFKYTPLRHVRVLFIEFCQGLFGAAPAGAYRWSADRDSTEIILESSHVIDPETINRRPGIHFHRGPIQFLSLGLDDRVTEDSQTMKTEKGILVPGAMTINPVSRVAQESEDLAWIIAEHLWLLRHTLMQAGFFDLGRQVQIGSPSQAGSIIANDMGDEFVVTPVTVPFQFARNSSFTPLGSAIVSNISTTLQRQITLLPGTERRSSDLDSYRVTAASPPSFAPAASDAQGATADPAGTRTYSLSKQPHPLNPAVQVSVRRVSSSRPR